MPDENNSQLELLPWIAVNGNMKDEFRAHIVQVAWNHYPVASTNLQRFATQALSVIKLKGFRRNKILQAPFRRVQPVLCQRMQKLPDVATAMIWLWAEARSTLIQELKELANQSSIVQFNSNWTFSDAVAGYYPPVEQFYTDTFFKFAERQSDEEITQWEYMLASLWLNSAVKTTETEEVSHNVQEPTLPLNKLNLTPTHVNMQDLCEITTQINTSLEDVYTATMQVTQTQTKLNEAITSSQVAAIEEFSGAIKTQIIQLDEKKKHLKNTIVRAFDAIQAVYLSTEDLDPDGEIIDTLTLKLNSGSDNIEALADEVKGHIEALIEYENKKSRLVEQITETHALIGTLTAELSSLSDSPSPENTVDIDLTSEVLSTMSVRVLQTDNDELQKTLVEMRALVNQARQNLAYEIERTIQQLVKDGISPDTIIYDTLQFQVADAENLLTYESSQLSEIAKQTWSTRDDYAQKRQLHTIEPAGQLLQKWDTVVFQNLLSQLAIEQRDLEVLLLWLIASDAKDINDIVVSPELIDSLLRGLEVFAGANNSFELFNSLTPLYWLSWSIDDPIAQAKTCLLFLGADYTKSYRLPEQTLWSLNIIEWSLPNMPTWTKLWELALTTEAIPPIVEQDILLQTLEDTRANAQQALTKDGHSFVRLHSIKSKRHAHYMGQQVLPLMEQQLGKLQKIEAKTKKKATHGHLQQLIQILTSLDDDVVLEYYQQGLADAGIHDTDPFHRRTSVNVVMEINALLKSYAEILHQFVEANINGKQTITKHDLQHELSQYKEIENLGTRVIEHLALNTSATMELDYLNYEEAKTDSKRHLVERLLLQPVFAMRSPRLVAQLVNSPIEIGDWLELCLTDLYRPLTTAKIGEHLLEQQAPNQALLLSTNLDIETQRHIQKLRDRLRTQLGQKENELLGLGGEIEDLRQARELGRYGLVLDILDHRIHKFQQQKEAEQQARDNTTTNLFIRVRELDEQVFSLRDQISRSAYTLLNDCLDIARTYIRQAIMVNEVDSLLHELAYRIDHQSWDIELLQSAYDEFLIRTQEVNSPSSTELTAETVLEYLENNELAELGVSQLTESRIATRTAFLDNWIKLKAAGNTYSHNLTRGEQTAVRNIYRHFANMMQMKHGANPQGEPLEYWDPLLVSVWRLKYPKTNVLNDDCLLVVLPGQLSPTSIKDFEDMLDEKEWLDYYFVILFLPSCSEAMRNRLANNYKGRGLVIIDDTVLLKLVLAERENTNPLGLLRPIMLNSKPVENIDIFKVNQLVDHRTSLFVGRDNLIQRLVTSGHNYAIYGGRRIGKSSVLNAVKERANRQGRKILWFSFEGEYDSTDNAIAQRIAKELDLSEDVHSVQDFKNALQNYLNHNPDVRILMLLDEIDRYINANQTRHLFIETLRTLTESNPSRLQVIIAGFMDLYSCLNGGGPYTPTSDPWQRMYNKELMQNLRASNAELIVREGFCEILGWQFESRSIPQRTVEMTGGHPAFVQKFCALVQHRVGTRGDQIVKMSDLQEVYNSNHPSDSYIAFVNATLGLNLKQTDRELIIWVALTEGTSSFGMNQLKELLATSDIPEDQLADSLNRLKATSVITENTPGNYEFTVPEYPVILERSGNVQFD